MRTKILTTLALCSISLAGCQTPQQVAEARSKLVCFQAGYGERSPQHDECMRTMLPVAQQMEMQRRIADMSEGLDLIAAGVRRR
ncbi:conserved hypothetical protein [Bosea sp. 62]|uniref:hypothetical protein n=1 Tax=unclassified Bosea (in: a-proteobacteria) TaxID=2653178 RepID=UPI001259ABCD|nr:MULTISPECIES: hypothetical protein [unclassified Bosea (in: a-proteobacteria)]CAD5257247.1 conserved hypothetical protein [Bosea sp. 7B]CAD5273036.1 conserved hypothetical protein [Bosea sp. 21B]CAD5285095.1 conserved hypothetical protein [Bosea sp. 46]VVT60252.1 conserved hypothetical protein [Bosea sp. EC-HK365B]VXB61007.1 conserved hypothetical protein [Bosea sp. 62]